MKKFRYIVEAVIVRTLIFLFGLIPPARSSNIGGGLAGFIGPRLSASRKAERHIQSALHTDVQETKQIVRGMWDNIGRGFAEYPHLPFIFKNYVDLIGQDNFEPTLRDKNTPAIFFSAHLANWEIAAPAVHQAGVDVDLIYRAPNNPYVEAILQRCRSMDGTLRTYPKSASGMRQVLIAMKQGRRIGILIDQKYNQGVEANFFEQPAMTSLAFIQLAKKFQCPLYPVRVERIDGVHFKVSVLPSLDIRKDDQTLLREAHDILESWISERPEQWLWLHKRWKK